VYLGSAFGVPQLLGITMSVVECIRMCRGRGVPWAKSADGNKLFHRVSGNRRHHGCHPRHAASRLRRGQNDLLTGIFRPQISQNSRAFFWVAWLNSNICWNTIAHIW